MVDKLYKKIEEVPELARIAMKLKDKFSYLLVLVRKTAKSLDVSDLKYLVRIDLTENRNPLIQHHINTLDRIELVEDLFDFLIDHHFIGYLNYKLLKKISDLITINSDELNERFHKYEEEYKSLLRASSFNCLIEVFRCHPNLSPTTAIGLPEMILCLDSPWTEGSVYTWEEYFNNRFPWTDSVAVKEYSTNCILITYAVFLSVLGDIMRDLTNPAIIAELKGNGVTIVQLPQEKGIVYSSTVCITDIASSMESLSITEVCNLLNY